MKEIRIFIASSMELLPERNYLSYLTLAMEDEFEKRGLRVRLSKWEYVDPLMTEERTEDRYLNEMYDCDAALVLFRNIAGRYTCEELDKAIAAERGGTSRLKAHEVLFAADGAPDSDAARLRSSLPDGSFGVWSSRDELRERFLALIDRVEQCGKLLEAPSDRNVRKVTAFLAADDELAAERDAFADTVLNVNELLEVANRGLRIVIRFYDPDHAEGVLDSSDMGLVIYGTNCRVFGREEIKQIRERKVARRNPKRFYVFFRDLDQAADKALDESFRRFRNEFVTKLDYFPCQFGDTNALRLSFLLLLERFVGESVRDYYSTVTVPAAPVFAGREEKLIKLCKLLEPVPGTFPFGRLPVVTGPGGVGKSELVRQVARQLRVQYPGGVFQVDMAHAKTWDDVFLGLLNGTPNSGVRVKEYLKIENDAGGSGPSRVPAGADVRNALLAMARRSGPVLLVLDNVESCSPLLGRDGGFLKAFPSGFSERVLVNVVATARVCDVALRPTDWAVELPLDDLSPEAALEVLFADRSEEDPAERKAAGRVAELLGYRALYLRRVPALIDDPFAQTQTFCKSYSDLAESLEKNPLATVAAETEETHLPEVLWKMTRERLLKMPLGAECVKLAEAAAFFPPEGFPRYILEHLWKTVVAPGMDERNFARAFEIVRRYNIFQSTDPVRIHRLDRAAILHGQGGEDSELLDSIGRSLASYYGASSEIWLSLAEQFPRIFQWIPDSIINGNVVRPYWTSFQAALLMANPIFADRCPCEKLNGSDWPSLLKKQPQFADLCAWEKLEGWGWVSLLENQPQFADKCAWEKLDGWDWARLLGKQPQFAGRCPWEQLKAWNWAWMRGKHVTVKTDRYPWELFGKQGWASLLGKQPQFADQCIWEKLDGRDWSDLLGKQPQFADNCPWEKLDGGNWASLLGKQPQLADRCPWKKLDGGDWASLLGEQPQRFVDQCPWQNLEGWDWASLLGKQPQFADRCPWETLTSEVSWPWASLLGDQPQFADRCPWDKLASEDWAYLLVLQPQFAGRCPWYYLDSGDWVSLLSDQPQFADRCPWEKLNGRDWASLLEKQPQFAAQCAWEKLDRWNWASLLWEQPQLAAQCAWEKLEGWNWAVLLGRQPQFADRCPWEKLDGEDWAWLLTEQPQFADKCDWNKLSEDDWVTLLEAQPQFADRRPQKN